MQYIRIPICLQEPLGLTESQEPRVKNRESRTENERIENRGQSREPRPRDESRTRDETKPRPREPRPRDE